MNKDWPDCVVCGGFLLLDRTTRPTDPVDWRNRTICDCCANERRQRGEKAASLRTSRRASRRSTCSKCNSKFWFPRSTNPWPTLCKGCTARIKTCVYCHATFESDDASKLTCSVACYRAHRASLWWLRLPFAYQETVADKLPNPEASKKFLAWEPSDERPGLYVVGTTGSGKTRTALLWGRKAAHRWQDVRYVRAARFASEVISRTRSAGGGFEAWIEEMRDADVLVIDELEKLKPSERVLVETFDLVEDRLAFGMTTVFLSNEDPLSFSKGLKDKAYCDAMLRRLTEFCSLLDFSMPRARRGKEAAR